MFAAYLYLNWRILMARQRGEDCVTASGDIFTTVSRTLERNLILISQLTMRAGKIQYCQSDFYL